MLLLRFIHWALLPALVLSDQRSCTSLAVRKEWRTLSSEERADWINAVKCLASIKHQRLSFIAQHTLLSGQRTLYDDYAYTHEAMDNTAHMNAYFLPWHRWFLYLFDTAIRSKCGYNGPTPYWDWTRDAEDLFSAPVFDKSAITGLGTTGDCSTNETDCTVLDGAFGQSSSFTLAWPIPHKLRRNLSLYITPKSVPHNQTLTRDHIDKLMQNTTAKGEDGGDFFKFQYSLSLSHNNLHYFVGGDMNSECPRGVDVERCEAASHSPNDPIFWLHHAQVDRLWSLWQHLNKKNEGAFQGYPLHSHAYNDTRFDFNATERHWLKYDRLSVPKHVSEVMDHTAYPLCYEYDDVRTRKEKGEFDQ